MRLLSLLAPCLAAVCLAPCALAASPGDRFGATVDEILAQPYQSAYVPARPRRRVRAGGSEHRPGRGLHVRLDPGQPRSARLAGRVLARR